MSTSTPNQGATQSPTDRSVAIGTSAVTGDQARAIFGQVMGLVALTLGCLALGAYLGRDLSGGIGIAFFLGGFACVIALNFASARGHDQLSTTLLFGVGALLGLALGPVFNTYAQADASALWQAAGTTAAFVAGLGAYGYGTRRDLSAWGRGLSWALVALIAFGIVALLVSIPHANVIWSIAGIALFGGFTIVDFNRLRRAGRDGAVPIAASIFLDILNVFLFALQLFGGGRD
jgi:FtsH-binding integral membrane protein